MLASVLQTSGYRTGLYTSPHLKEFTERIRVDGKEVSREYVVDFVNRIRASIEEIRPSFFEITVAMAFDYFAGQSVDVAVIEVGLGGKLDSTNVIMPLVSVITNIGWDHKDLLGETLPEIAAQKAGIIKRAVPAVVSERQPEVEDVFINAAREKNAPLFFASDEYTVLNAGTESIDILKGGATVLADVHVPLRGYYQRRNIPGVVKTIAVLKPHFAVSDAQLRTGLEDVIVNTQLKGRWQTISNNPPVVCDTGHNLDGVQEVMRQVFARKHNHLYIIWGMVKDKDFRPILELLPKDARYYFCQAKIPRAMDDVALQQAAADIVLTGAVIRDVNEAKRAAVAQAGPDDFIFIGGSTYVVAEIDDL